MMSRLAACVIIMAVVTYIPRVFPLVLMKNRRIESRFIKSFLDYTPYAVLGSMTFPYIVNSTGNLYTGLAGTIVALALSYYNKGLTKVAIYTVAAVYLASFIFD